MIRYFVEIGYCVCGWGSLNEMPSIIEGAKGDTHGTLVNGHPTWQLEEMTFNAALLTSRLDLVSL